MIKTTFTLIIGSAFAALLTGCASHEAFVRSEFDENKVPAQFASYSWLKEAKGDDTLSNNLHIYETIQSSIESELNKKGHRKSATSDYKIGMLIVDRDQGINYTLDRYFGDSLRGADIKSLPNLTGKSLEQGTIIVDAVDVESGRLVWRGTALTEVNRKNSPDTRADKIKAIVSSLMASFPQPRP